MGEATAAPSVDNATKEISVDTAEAVVPPKNDFETTQVVGNGNRIFCGIAKENAGFQDFSKTACGTEDRHESKRGQGLTDQPGLSGLVIRQSSITRTSG
ncbi:hypothetical protein RAA17_24175 [Komagataeibacter rhaeticus]|nr:hypothetical protein [Komagataeibacter rhaeticus]